MKTRDDLAVLGMGTVLAASLALGLARSRSADGRSLGTPDRATRAQLGAASVDRVNPLGRRSAGRRHLPAWWRSSATGPPQRRRAS